MVQDRELPAGRGGRLVVANHLQLHAVCHQKRQGRLLGRPIGHLPRRMEPRRAMGAVEVQSGIRRADGVFHHGKGADRIVRNFPSLIPLGVLIHNSYDDDRVMEFVLMRLTFSDGPSGESSPNPPIFSHVTEFRTTGVVMNVFLLDPSERLLSAFIWVSTSNTIGLYALPDWNKKEYVFIDTGIECVSSRF